MKTFLITVIAFIGIFSVAPESQARDCDRYDRGRHSYYSGRSSYGHGYYHSGYRSRSHYGYGRYYSSPRYYSSHRYYSSPRYYRSDRCYPEYRRSYRSPLISFAFGF